jgi:hypothetical protein
VPDKDKTPALAEEAEEEATEGQPAEARGKAGEPGEADEAAARVAEALGVGGEEEKAEQEPAEAQEAKPPPNRAARRREEALARRRRAASAEDAPRPKDRNVRAKELLTRRKEAAAERRPVQLDAGEMVEDVLARATSGVTKWVRKNFALLQWGIIGAIALTGAVLFYLSRVEKKEGRISESLAVAVAADRGRVLEEDKRSDDEKELDPTRVFKTSAERADAALAAYNQVIDQHAGTGAALLAKLGQAGALLDKKEYGPALEAYSAVVASPLAGADADVKGRALEGMGFAKEGKGDLDGALETFKQLEAIDAKGYKELAQYHQARILIAKGDTEKAKELLKVAREKLSAPGLDQNTFQYLEAVIDETLRKLDPSAVPARAQLGGPKGSSMSPEELERLIQQARENAEKKAGGEHEGE